jgi:conjugal transfer pilus assembly protein TraW
LLLAGLLIPVAALADPAGEAALRSLRDEAAAIHRAVEAAERPAWLAANPHEAARVAGEALGTAQSERFREGLPAMSACRDLGQLCPPDTPSGTLGSDLAAIAGAASGLMAGEGRDVNPSKSASAADTITITVLVSRSLGSAQLREILALAAGLPAVQIAFRGVAEDESLMDFVRQTHSLLAGLDPIPEVVLDPTPFHTAGIDLAPVLIATGPDGELARVAGLADPAWLRARVLAGERGDLGIRGPVEAVSEPDLIAELQRRLAALDLTRLREQAIGRFWSQVAFEPLPVAAEARMRTVDPTLTAAADIRTADGTLLVRVGDRVNPLDRLPFTQRLVVFDAADARQVATAERLGRETDGRRVVYLAAALDRTTGWAGLAAVEDRLDAPVYLLTPDVRARFALERVPAFVEAQGTLFRVAEVPPEDSP